VTTIPAGPLSEEEVRQFLKVYDHKMGGAYKNYAFPMAAAHCLICGEWTLFSKASAEVKANNIRTCGLWSCMQTMAARDKGEAA